MLKSRWIALSIFLTLQIAAEDPLHSSIVTRDGDDASLPCRDEKARRYKCNGTNWIRRRSRDIVDLVIRGQILNPNESNRHSLGAECSLAIKGVTKEDVGLYYCHESGQQADYQVDLSVVNLTQHEDGGHVKLTCSAWTQSSCRHTLKWLHEGKAVDADEGDAQTPSSECSATVTFPASNLTQTSTYAKEFECQVEDGFTKKLLLVNFRSAPSGDTAATASPEPPNRTSEGGKKSTPKTTVPDTSGTLPTMPPGLWFYVAVAVALAALVLIFALLITWRTTKGKKTKADEDAVDPEDALTYTSVSYVKKSRSKVQVQRDNADDGGDAVTYSTLNIPAGASAGRPNRS